jgi:hypothetical protein
MTNEYVHFEPIPVFVGAKEGWTGPILAARSDAKPALEDTKLAPDATAYTSEKDPGSPAPAELAAPIALQGAVKPPAPAPAKSKAPKIAAAAKPNAVKPKHPPVKPKN